MLKISPAGKTGQRITLKLEGRVIGPWVSELRSICEALLGDGGKPNLDLRDVSYADFEGAELLKELHLRGVALTNLPPFVNEQLKAAMGRPD